MQTKKSEYLDEKEVERDPIRQFQIWLDDAIAANIPLAEAMTLATATPDGRPAARMVLLKQVDQNGFVFFTNYRSAKARQLDTNPYAALVFYWNVLERQVRVEGSVVRTSAEESREYFQTRPRESQIGAWASEQSAVIRSRDVLEQRAQELETLYCDRDVDCPEYWGGYRLKPDRIEFWKGRLGRLHDRILYELDSSETWTISRLAR
jgi:pyridoxamine 5'-phosphate oxidase